MSYPRPPRRDASRRATVSLRDLALNERERAFYGPRTGDWMLLGLMVVILLGNGAYIWHQTGAGSHVGRAAFFGLLLLCVVWVALVYTFKLSVCVRVGPQGLSVVRGPWRTELTWREVARLTERSQLIQGQRYRWLVALARDGRKMQIRDDMVNDYPRFRVEVYERYRLWRDHGGTWGATGGGPYSAREKLAGQTIWAAVGAGTLALPAVYFLVLLPETDPLGWVLLAVAGVCAIISGRGMLRRTTYTVDAKAIEARQRTGALRLAWRNVAKVERTRHAFGGVIAVGIGIGRFALKLVARTDGRVESFDWAPRVPEYLTLRGGGHQVRVRLHRLARPDELLAWVEFYERVGRRTTESQPLRKTGGPTRQLTPEPPVDQLVGASGGRPLEEHTAPMPPDLSGAAGPLDPWGSGRDGEPETDRTSSALAEQAAGEDNWLRGEPPVPQPAPLAAKRPPLTPTAPPFTTHPPEDARGQSLSGLDIFASQPELDAISPAPTIREDLAPPPPPQPTQPQRVGYPWEPDPRFVAPPRTSHSVPESHERQVPRVAESWQPTEAVPHWQPSQPEPQPSVLDEGWLADEIEPVSPDGAPTDAIENLADSFAPWREDASWQPPQLPRFGPPPRDESER